MSSARITACVRHIKLAVIRKGRHASCEKQTTCLGSTQLGFHPGKKPTPNALKNSGFPANVKLCSISFEHFSLGHVFCATVMCPFSTSQTSKRGPRTSVFNAFHLLRAKVACTFHSACTFSTSQRCVPRPSVLNSFHLATSFVHFFHISTSKSGPGPSVFVISTSNKCGPRPIVLNTFDFEMCFASQLRALFKHLNIQRRCDTTVFCTF